MNPATLALIVQGIEAAIAAAPQVESLVTKAKDFVSELFTSNAITEDQQNQIFAHVDAITAAFANGQTPPAWQVEADPGSTTSAPATGTSAPENSGSAPTNAS